MIDIPHIMEWIGCNGLAVSVNVSVAVYIYLDQASHKSENLARRQRRLGYLITICFLGFKKSKKLALNA